MEEKSEGEISLLKEMKENGIEFLTYVPTDSLLRKLQKENKSKDMMEEIEEKLIAYIQPLMKKRDSEINLVPPKANWDLKKGLKQDLEYLDGLTKEAIQQLVLEKMAREENEEEGEVDE